MAQYYERIKQSLNLRTLYGLIALASLLGIAFIARMDDAAASAKEARVQVDERLARHGGAIDERVWRERAENAEQALTLWRATQWSGPTAGVVAAELQGAISGVAAAAQLNVLSVTVEPAPVELSDGTVLRFRMAADSRSGESVAKTLAAFGAHEPMIIVDGMNAVFDEEARGRFSVSGYAPIAIAAPQAQESG